MLNERKRIMIGMGWNGACHRGVLRGIRGFERFDRWDVRLEPIGPNALAAVNEWQPDGIIGHFPDSLPAMEDQLRERKIPIVNVLSIDNFPEIPHVGQENSHVGRLSAHYFLERGYRSFGYVGVPWKSVSQATRLSAYEQEVQHAGFSVQSFPPRGKSGKASTMALKRWLAELPRSTALLAHYDICGREVLELCRQVGRRVPDDVAVLGVDNDDVFCDLSTPKLSSVSFPWERIGHESARMMSEWLDGGPVPSSVLIPPDGIVARESTDITAIEDAALAKAMAYIQDYYNEEPTVDMIAQAAGLSRRALERRFRKVFQRSPNEQIRKLRIRHACQLLLSGDESIKMIAHLVGFSSPERFAVVFKQLTGRSPSRYRSVK